jgi:hypothetical protein
MTFRWRTPEQAVTEALEQEVVALRNLLRRLLAESLRSGERVQDSEAVATARQILEPNATSHRRSS